MSNFAFLRDEWPRVFDSALRAENAVHTDPRASCFYARRTLELAMEWLYLHDRTLRMPYQRELSSLIHEPTFKNAAGAPVFTKAKLIKDLGNQAVHSNRMLPASDALVAVRELFHFGYWLARTYARGARPADSIAFNPALVPATSPIPRQTQEQLKQLEGQLADKLAELEQLRLGRDELDAELKAAREEVARIKAENAKDHDDHDYSEAETRDFFIDLLLREAGWPLANKEDREYPVSGMPNNNGNGFVDYVLWGSDGKPLGLVEAKRTKRGSREGQQQAKLYADCLEAQFGQRPVIFCSNGYEHWIWDDSMYPPRPVQGFYKRDELELLIQRRTSRRPLSLASVDPAIVGRHYQTRAIRRIGEAFERDNDRKALLVMATGAGKTRTVIALADVLMRAQWAKRVLFLADRVALVNQAVGAFKKHLPASSPVNLVTEKNAQGRVYVSTYPTMMRLIDERKGDLREFGPGHFDLIVIDEAHRSVYQKYGAIFEYFDSLLVGLTATPKDEVDRNTYGLFELEDGVPTDAYSLDEAIKDKHLVPPRAVSVPDKFQREGIKYADLTEDDKDEWDALEWDEDGTVPDRVEAAAVNSWLFNKDTVDRVLEHLMTRGQKVAGGDRLGKTIIFAKNHQHAMYIADRFNANYPHYNGHFASVIDFKVDYAQSLIDDFSIPEKSPHIAISVDMLDTGIDIPEVVNLVFFKLVRSKTKFWQMLGRGTRLREDLFGPGQHKEFFYVFDYCQNLEYFSQDLPPVEGSLPESLTKSLFNGRLELILETDRRVEAGSAMTLRETATAYEAGAKGEVEVATEPELRIAVAKQLQSEVLGMCLDNFLVRPHRRLVEVFANPESWEVLTPESASQLSKEVAGLPSATSDQNEDAKRFDLLLLRLQLALLKSEPGFARLRDQVKAIASSLEEKANIPMVHAQIELIQDIQTDTFWQDVTTPMLERVRRRLRSLVGLIEKSQRKIVFTDFRDELGADREIELPGIGSSVDLERFRAKARSFLRAHQDHISIQRLRLNQPLTQVDLPELESMLMAAGGSPEEIARAATASEGIGLFIRSVVGLDREAAKQAFNEFLTGSTVNSTQIEFIDVIINHLAEHGLMDPGLLYKSPFIDFSAKGPEGVFASSQVDGLISVLREIRKTAVV